MLFLLKREHRIAFAATFVVFINIHKTMKHFYFILICCLFPLFNLHAEGEAEAIIDSGRWIIHFSELREEQDNYNTFRNMDVDLNFLRVEGDTCTLQIVKRGAQKIEMPGRDVAMNKHHYIEFPNEPGLGGTVIQRKLLDLKKTHKRKGALQIDFQLDNLHTKVRINISADNTWSTISVSGFARMRGGGVERL